MDQATASIVLKASEIAPELRKRFEHDRQFRQLVEAAKAGELPEDQAREVLALAGKTRKIHTHGGRDFTLAEFTTAVAVLSDMSFGVVDGTSQQIVCAGWKGACSKRPPKNAFSPRRIRARDGRPWRCRTCSAKRNNALLTREQRSEATKKAAAALTPKQRSANARKATEAAQKANALMTQEQRFERARKAGAAANVVLTIEQRRENGKKGAATRWRTRRAKKSAK